MTIKQIKTIGTQIPQSKECVKYTTVFDKDHWFSSTSYIFYEKNCVVFKVITHLGEECIITERADYTGTNKFIIPISELIRIGIVEPEFVLPKKYCVENTKESCKWLEDISVSYVNNIKYFNYFTPDLVSGTRLHDKIPNGYTLLTNEQFLKYILKQKTMNIIGYKVLKLVPFTTYKIGDTIVENNSYKDFENCKNYPEFFEPIYEEEYKIGDYKVVFFPTNRKGIEINNSFYTKQHLLTIKEVLEINPSQIKSLNVGCSGQFKVDLTLISKILNRLK